ncbi:response regulator transcription factor [Aerococcus sp. Group 1]|uniref:response regulator transcription factor n=1 Tax=Aerococcus urinae (strain CCUG 59500 / ACS-120-V-Col10a) TaxID=2976812 RepID=UPI00227BD44D|nr:response regulator transcription factor [Aerococcus sp. Group 1]MCY3061760.1 response regulator transcription factor [Aerococcus sp. Group 1]
MKIILLDDHKLFGGSLKMLLEEQEEISCAYVSKAQEFLKMVEKEIYDIFLIDINLKDDKTGLDLIKDLIDENPRQKIIVLTSYDLDNYKDMAFKLGVKDFINKSVEIEELLERIINVYKGNYKKIDKYIVDPLTKREIEVLEELIKGSSKKDIAKKLFISERTLYNHIANIYDKLQSKNIVEAYNKAMELGYIYPVM